MDFTHLDEKGRGRMVDISSKNPTTRQAVAVGQIKVSSEIMEKIKEGEIKKGDVLSISQIAGIMGVKETHRLIPLCHPLEITGVDMNFEIKSNENSIYAYCTVKTFGKTGVEMEALTGVSVALLTIYDMCKALDKGMVIGEIKLLEKKGGKSGHYLR